MTNVTQQLPAYAYQQYSDDADVVAFFTAYNKLSQQNLDEINALELPNYLIQSGDLLNWTANGIYGVVRRDLPSGDPRAVGPLNTWEANAETPNEFKYVDVGTTFAITDLAFQRIVQWNTFKGDGFNFSIRWLKRRIIRFLGGALFPPNTYQVSVTFPDAVSVLIKLTPGLAAISGGALFDAALYAGTVPFNGSIVTVAREVPLDLAPVLSAGLAAGALQFPFQYTNITVEY